MKNKTDYRLYAKELRKSLDMTLISRNLCMKIRKNPYYVLAKNVMIFYPTEYEIDLRDLVNDDKKFYLPRVEGDNLAVCPYCDELKKSKFNIMEPLSEKVCEDCLDLIFVPALSADKDNYRLGYGGGYYDRFLPKCKNAYKITVVPKALYVKKLPCEEFDVKTDEVITG